MPIKTSTHFLTMVSSLATFLPLLLTSTQVAPALAQESTPHRVKIVFQLVAPSLDPNQTVYVTGSIPELGNWNPRAVEMEARGKGRWTYSVECDSIRVIEYKFTLGTWEREAADARGQRLANFSVDGRESVAKEHEVGFWTEPGARQVTGQITGSVRYHELKGTELLKPRKLIVWVPPDYEQSEERLPVLYMHDGQNLFDPQTSSFGIDWQIDETCTRLIEAGELPPLIVVGIYNTPDRSKEYQPGEFGDAYRELVLREVKPMIDREYRTRPQREHTFVGGSSYGGLCSFVMAWEHPEVFSKALCFSPAFRTSTRREAKFDYVQYVKDSPKPTESLFFYIDNGGVGLEILLQPGIDAMLEVLAEKGFEKRRDFVWQHAPKAGHSEKAWAERFPAAVKTLFKTD